MDGFLIGDETERLLASKGIASYGSVREILRALLHGQDAGWGIVGVTDETHLDLGKVLGRLAPVEVGPRARTITIKLVESHTNQELPDAETPPRA